jgi:ATP-binding cassette subfamily B protein
LLGRPGAIGDADIQEAEAVCEELGLGDLLRRMPAGIMQQVGEGGWQLSHGERSRVYVARALLQDADVVILDEGFAALDASNLQRAIECVDRRAHAVLAIAHC